MKVYIHIGAHKTGTTSIQAFLREHASDFAAAGIYVPTVGTLDDPKSGHHNVGWGLRGDPRFDPAKGSLHDLLRELQHARSDSAVISSEDFEYLVDRPADLIRMEKEFRAAGHSVRYIIFVRRPLTYAPSLYVELLQHGLTGSYLEFIRDIVKRGKFVLHGDWCFYFDAPAFIRKWREAAAGPLVVESYEEAVAKKGIVPTFLSAIRATDDLVQLGSTAEILNRHNRYPQTIPPFARLLGTVRLWSRFGGSSSWPAYLNEGCQEQF